MKRWSRFTLVLMVILLTVFLQGCNSAPAPQTLGNEQRMVIRVATDYRMDSIGYQQLQEFGKMVESKRRYLQHFFELQKTWKKQH